MTIVHHILLINDKKHVIYQNFMSFLQEKNSNVLDKIINFSPNLTYYYQKLVFFNLCTNLT